MKNLLLALVVVRCLDGCKKEKTYYEIIADIDKRLVVTKTDSQFVISNNYSGSVRFCNNAEVNSVRGIIYYLNVEGMYIPANGTRNFKYNTFVNSYLNDTLLSKPHNWIDYACFYFYNDGKYNVSNNTVFKSCSLL